MRAHVCTYICVHIHVCINIYIYEYTYIYTYITIYMPIVSVILESQLATRFTGQNNYILGNICGSKWGPIPTVLGSSRRNIVQLVYK